MNVNDIWPYIADAFVILGVTVMTLGVFGITRMPDIYTKLHAASKSAFLGVVSLCVAAMFTGDQGIIMRAILIAVALLLSTPISSHVIGRGAYLERERMETPTAQDESGQSLRHGVPGERQDQERGHSSPTLGLPPIAGD
jgi:multicomponent Na+:H+ antiporter subunit G